MGVSRVSVWRRQRGVPAQRSGRRRLRQREGLRRRGGPRTDEAAAAARQGRQAAQNARRSGVEEERKEAIEPRRGSGRSAQLR